VEQLLKIAKEFVEQPNSTGTPFVAVTSWSSMVGGRHRLSHHPKVPLRCLFRRQKAVFYL